MYKKRLDKEILRLQTLLTDILKTVRFKIKPCIIKKSEMRDRNNCNLIYCA